MANYVSSLTAQQIENALLASKAATAINGLVKYNGASGGESSVSQAVPGTDYASPSTVQSVTLAAGESSWSGNTQTISVTGMTSDKNIIISPAPASLATYYTCGVYCSAQASGTLTFTCTTVPSAQLTVNLMIVG